MAGTAPMEGTSTEHTVFHERHIACLQDDLKPSLYRYVDVKLHTWTGQWKRRDRTSTQSSSCSVCARSFTSKCGEPTSPTTCFTALISFPSTNPQRMADKWNYSYKHPVCFFARTTCTREAGVMDKMVHQEREGSCLGLSCGIRPFKRHPKPHPWLFHLDIDCLPFKMRIASHSSSPWWNEDKIQINKRLIPAVPGILWNLFAILVYCLHTGFRPSLVFYNGILWRNTTLDCYDDSTVGNVILVHTIHDQQSVSAQLTMAVLPPECSGGLALFTVLVKQLHVCPLK